MKLAEFDFHLPPELIANKPVKPRDSARMLVMGNNLMDESVKNLPDFLEAGDIMVFNDTKVIPARLVGKCGGMNAEITLLRCHSRKGGNPYSRVGEVLAVTDRPVVMGSRLRGNDTSIWSAFAKPAKKMKIGEEFIVAENFTAKILEKNFGEVVLDFGNINNFMQLLQKYGAMPLPPYIKRPEKNYADNENYQTIFAREAGAVAAPTAGLHFTEQLLQRIKDKGIKTAFVTLHVGAGTFLPVKTEDIEEHKMHSEFFSVNAEAADAINAARENGGRVVAVGTTSLRVLETIADETGQIKSASGETAIFITPGYKFKIVDMLLTNFHLPKSTLFMLVSAFAGMEKMREAYRHAIENRYRFFSYGDACLLRCHTRA